VAVQLTRAVEVDEQTFLALKLQVDPIVLERAPVSPLCIFARQDYNSAEAVGRPNQSKDNFGTSHRL
jgi:hypothetical protein